MFKLLVSTVTALVIATSASAGNKVLEHRKERSFASCSVKLGAAAQGLANKGAKVTLIVDTPSEQLAIFRVKLKGKTAFLSCDRRIYKAWLM